jgi:hypothetical protein
MKTQIRIFLLAAFTFLVGGLMAGATGFNPAAGGAVLMVASLFVPQAQGSLLSAIQITELTTKLGEYFRKDKGGIINELLLGMDIGDRFEMWDDCKDEVPLPNLSITDLIKPANDTTFSGTANALAFGARILKVRRYKVDLLLVPNVLEKTWLGKYRQKGSNPMDLPFEAFIMQYITERVHENMRMKALFAGVYNAGGTTPGAVMDGVLKLIADEITATNITPVVTGAITNANVIDKLEQVYDSLGEAYKASETQMLVNPTIFDWYTRKYRLDYGANTDYSGMPAGMFRLDGTSCVVKREPGLGASQRVICTPVSNLVYGVDSFSEENNIRVQEFERTIKLMIDAKAGVQFKEIHGRALAVSNQA